MKKVLVLMLVTFIATGLLIAGGTKESATTGAQPVLAVQETIVIGEILIPRNMNPLTNPNPFVRRSIGQMYEGLVALDAQKNIIPCIASSWTISDDGLEYVFTLDSAAMFTNGKPVTVEDVKFSFDTMLSNAVAFMLLADVDTVGIAGPSQVKITLKRPSITQLYYLALALIASKEEVMAAGNEYGITTKGMVGSGPFRVVEWKQGVSLKLERNENYRNGAPLTKYIELRQLGDPTTALSALESGEIQVTANLLSTDYSIVEADPALKLVSAPAIGPNALFFNLNYAPLQDPNVRKAIAYAINRNDTALVGTDGYGTIATGFITQQGMKGYSQTGNPLPYDKTKAIQALQSSGYPQGFELKVSALPNGDDKVAEVLIQNLADIGIKATISLEEPLGFSERMQTGAYHCAVGSLSQLFGNPIEFMTQIITAGGFNYGRYSNTKVDALFAQANNVTDISKQAELYRQINDLLKTDLPFIPLFLSPNVAAMAAGIEGYTITGAYDVQRYDSLVWRR